MVFGKERQKLVQMVGPAVESMGNAAVAVIALAVVAVVVSVIALAVASKAGRVTA